MGRVVHFEIHVDDMERAKSFMGMYSDGPFRTGVSMQECLTTEQ